jgi:hypothetical protein
MDDQRTDREGGWRANVSQEFWDAFDKLIELMDEEEETFNREGLSENTRRKHRAASACFAEFREKHLWEMEALVKKSNPTT